MQETLKVYLVQINHVFVQEIPVSTISRHSTSIWKVFIPRFESILCLFYYSHASCHHMSCTNYFILC